MRYFRDGADVPGKAERRPMTHQAPSSRIATSLIPPVAVAAIAAAMFVVDANTPAELAVSVLYVTVVLLAARFWRTRGVLLVSVGCMALTVVAFLVAPASVSDSTAAFNTGLSILANGVTTFLVLRGQAADAALRERASLLDLTHDSIFSRGMNDAITYWNRGAEELYGWKRAEAIGKVPHQLLETTFPAPRDDIYAELVRMGRWEGELVHKKRDGTRVVVDSRWSLQRDTQGKPAAILETTTDITERKKAQESLRQAQADLARVNRVMLLGEMTASIAHEVNQPIAAAVTNAGTCLHWLAAQPPEMEKARQALDRIVRDAKRASEVIARIRALVKKVPPRRDFLNINEAIFEVIALTQSELPRNRVTLQTRLSSDLPLVPADRVQLQQVILNLIVNAIEAMSDMDDRPRELTVGSGGGDSNDVFVEVQDSGPGLDPANLEPVFQSFHTTKPDGMGMGLAISRSIVEAHGGRLWAAPNQPHGAVFRFTLPVEEESSADALPSPS
jgi:two-component system sensor kinase FixL